MSNFILKDNLEDIKEALINDYRENDFFPNVYLTETQDNFFLGAGSANIDDEGCIYVIEKGSNKIFDKIIPKDKDESDINHRLKTYEYLIGPYNTSDSELVEIIPIYL